MNQRTEVVTRTVDKPFALQAMEWSVGSVSYPPALRAEIVLVNQIIQQCNLPVEYMGATRLFTGEQRFPIRGTDLEARAMPIDEDPLFYLESGFPAPDSVVERLKMIDESPLNPTTYYILHECRPGGSSPTGRTTLDELMPPPPLASRQETAKLGAVASNLLNIARLPFLGALGGLALAAAPVAAIAGLAAGLDPVLMAVFADPEVGCRPGALAAWYYVDSWVYE